MTPHMLTMYQAWVCSLMVCHVMICQSDGVSYEA